jgi:hypothetical protein
MAALTGNPNDEIRRQMLGYFYDRNANATSRTGKTGSAITISDVKRDLKAPHNLSQPQVVSNLNYLIGRKWVETVDESKSFTARGGTTRPSVTTYFQISALGIEKIEGDSEFQPRDRYAGINIQATGENVITLGDGTVVNVRNEGLFQQLNQLKEQITDSDAVSEDMKMDVAVDIETLKTQLAKHDPDKRQRSLSEELADRRLDRHDETGEARDIGGPRDALPQALEPAEGVTGNRVSVATFGGHAASKRPASSASSGPPRPYGETIADRTVTSLEALPMHLRRSSAGLSPARVAGGRLRRSVKTRGDGWWEPSASFGEIQVLTSRPAYGRTNIKSHHRLRRQSQPERGSASSSAAPVAVLARFSQSPCGGAAETRESRSASRMSSSGRGVRIRPSFDTG